MEYRDIFKEKTLTIPNALTFVRLLLFIPFVCLVLEHAERPTLPKLWWILGIGFVGASTDYLDGIFARKYDQITYLGKYLDAVSDKIISIVTFTLLVTEFAFPVWIFALYLARELGGVGLVWFLFRRKDFVPSPNIWGKLGVNIAVIAAFWYIAKPVIEIHLRAGHWLHYPEIAAYLFLLVLVLGVVQYLLNFFPILFRSK
jgi:CDP-diacylglycerol--glycerol-3-phosphate 3-phosphatidyltransferase